MYMYVQYMYMYVQYIYMYMYISAAVYMYNVHVHPYLASFLKCIYNVYHMPICTCFRASGVEEYTMERGPYLTAVVSATWGCGLMGHQLVSTHFIQ